MVGYTTYNIQKWVTTPIRKIYLPVNRQPQKLRHPPFGLLKTIFPHLFTKEFVESFKCDVCQFSKHHHATFSPSNNKSLEPFDLIHFDVWGQLVTLY
ncbi:hypothetical protein CR513_61514, partial [Mucuna pruriens]